MSRVHLCLGRLADNPYTFEKSRVRVFSIEELCFFLRENAYLLDENIFTRGLFDWIGKECALPDLGQKLNMLLKNKEKPGNTASGGGERGCDAVREAEGQGGLFPGKQALCAGVAGIPEAAS